MNDSELDDRVRLGLLAIADAVGEPPVLDALALRESVRSSRPAWVGAMAMAAVVIVVIAGLALVARRDERSAGSDLFGTIWRLNSVTVDGVPVTNAGDRSVRWEFSRGASCNGPEPMCVAGNDGCNHFSRGVQTNDDGVTMKWGATWQTTAMACLSDLSRAFDRFMLAPSFEYAQVSGTLRLVAEDVELVFVRDGEPLGPARGELLDAGRIGDVTFRVTWNESLMHLDWMIDGNPHVNTADVGEFAEEVGVVIVDIDGTAYLMGTLPPATHRAEFRSDNGSVTELVVHDIAGLTGKVVAQVVEVENVGTALSVPDPTATYAAVIAYDAAGAELGRSETVGGMFLPPETVPPEVPESAPPTTPTPG